MRIELDPEVNSGFGSGRLRNRLRLRHHSYVIFFTFSAAVSQSNLVEQHSNTAKDERS
jgi:hypothetical protein